MSHDEHAYDAAYCSDPDERSWKPPDLHRLTHLVLVDGRLVDLWTEPLDGSKWQRYVDEFDRARTRQPAVVTPPEPAYHVMLDWLDNLVGGRRALEAMTTDPLAGDGLDLPVTDLDIRARHRLEATAQLLDSTDEKCFDHETVIALRRGLLLAWAAEPETILRAKSAAHTAGGVCWAIGKANGLYGANGVVAQGRVQETLSLSTPISGPGPTIQRALQGFLTANVQRPGTGPDLLPLGHPELLTSSTRRLLVRLRDRALVAKADRDAG
jgi:hypothetical protein